MLPVHVNQKARAAGSSTRALKKRLNTLFLTCKLQAFQTALIPGLVLLLILALIVFGITQSFSPQHMQTETSYAQPTYTDKLNAHDNYNSNTRNNKQTEKLRQERKQDSTAETLSSEQNDGRPVIEVDRNKKQHIPEKRAPSTAAPEYMEFVKQEFLHAWNGYKKYAWGKDELNPVTKTGKDWLGLGATIVDSLDTLWIMGLKEDFKEARDWIDTKLDFDRIHQSMSNFETVIRVLGGLLSAYDLSGDEMFLKKAENLGTRMISAMFSGGAHQKLPYATINLKRNNGQYPTWTSSNAILSEVGTLQMEFFYLAMKTNRPELATRILDVFNLLDKLPKENGLYPIYLNPKTNTFSGTQVTFGALGDSYYEYLLKMWLLTNKQAPGFRRMYDEAMKPALEQLIQRSSPTGLVYLAEMQGSKLVHKMDHLVCFAGGMIALGSSEKRATEAGDYEFGLGAGITETCHEMYTRQATKISPEFVNFAEGKDLYVPERAPHYLLRPEAVESFFYLWRLTHEQKYRDWGLEALKAIKQYCRTEGGYSGIRDVRNIHSSYDNTQQTFFLAETLKYLYLLFTDDDVIPLDKYVFNTEAHPLSVFSSPMTAWPQELVSHFPEA